MMRTVIAWLRATSTPKRVFTAVMGVVALLRGLAYIWPDGAPAGLQTLSQVPGGLVAWGWVWLTVGTIAASGVFRHSQSATLIPFVAVNVLWGGSYLIEWASRLEWVIPTWQPWTWQMVSESRDWITCISYFGLAVATLTVIRLIDPAEVRSRTRGTSE